MPSPRQALGRLSLQTRFMLYFGMTVLFLMTFVILIVSNRQYRTLLHQSQLRGEAVAHSISAAMGSALMSYDYVRLQQVAETAAEDPDVLYVIVLDKENLVAGYNSRASMQGHRLDDAVSTEAIVSGELRTQRVDDSSEHGTPYLDIAMPVRSENSPVIWGWVRVGLSLESTLRDVASTRQLLLMLGVVAGLVVLGAARVLGRRFTRPLRDLVKATAAVASGGLNHEVSEDLPAELGEVARSFNTMTKDLRRSQEAVNYQRQHLENMVQERTAALREKARELELANAELMEIDRLKSDFLSNVSHELRTPLTSIRSFTEILLDGNVEVPEAEQREFLSIVVGQAKRLTRLINDLLDLSKIEAGEFQCNMGMCDVRQSVVSTIETLASLAKEKGVQLVCNMDEGLPRVWADPDRVSQVLTNLIDNALKFTPEGGSVTISAHQSAHRRRGPGLTGGFAGIESDTPPAAEYVVVAVRDTGPGIRPQDQQRIFEKFGQVGNVLTDKPQGTGLGLAICGTIAALHSGALWVESEPERGSVFALSIPVAAETAVSTARDDATEPSESPAVAADLEPLLAAIERSADGKRLVLVDDEPAIVSFLTGQLEQLGYRVVGCFSGGQAVAKARLIQPDAIILDLEMPELTGYDVLRLLKSDPDTAEIPVVVLATNEDENHAYFLGAAEFVAKEFQALGIDPTLVVSS